ncbi:MAG: spore cortex-lytic enzyme [Clostridia bacterium]|nr:spore cortex-lytic enzyme [Clostridia bacterium]MDE7329322.1 spore cortex-lytic enzyme [Clostridia bacterium]
MDKKVIIKTSIVAVLLLVTITVGIVSFYTAAPAEEVAVLKMGSSGSQVRTLQTKLNRWGYNCGTVDGIFGTKTYNAVKQFQRNNGLTVDGIVGAKTAAALGMTLTSGSSSNSSYNSSDVYLLAKCIYAESRGEPYLGQVAVGAVVLNRVKSSSFPNSISGVVYQPYAFTAVADGQINLEPNETAYSAARDAMNGWDPTNGCIYYYNPATATSSWIWSRTVKLRIGKHSFAV